MEEIFNEREGNESWRTYYFDLRRQSLHDAVGKTSKTAIANNKLNRYSDVLPYDDSRVILLGTDCDYINASNIVFEETGQKYIMSQAPMDFTCVHFWKMIWQANVTSIIMLCKTVENQKNKCAQYWPSNPSKDVVFGNYRISMTSFEQSFEYNISTLTLTHQNKKQDNSGSFKSTDADEKNNQRTLTHFHYHAWPDFGIPDSPDSFLKFLCLVRQKNTSSSPSVIHCSAGIGRSGVYAVCDIIIQLFEDTDLSEWNSISFDDVLRELRLQRMGLIQSPDQLRFTYKAILRAKFHMCQNQWPDYYLGSPGTVICDSDTDNSGEEMPAPPPPLRNGSLTHQYDSVPPIPSTTIANHKIFTSSADSDRELRQRRKEQMADKVAKIKVNMKKQDQNREFWKTYWLHICGIGALIFGTCAYMYLRSS